MGIFNELSVAGKRENDVVLDCFSGSGAVLSKADNMKRRYIGFELNKEYIQMFDNYLEKTVNQKRQEYEIMENNLIRQDDFQQLILNLRALKYARILLGKLNIDEIENIIRIYVERSEKIPNKTNSLVVVNYFMLISDIKLQSKLEIKLNELINKAPLSKYGIEPLFKFILNTEEFLNIITDQEIYVYSNKITHKFKSIFNSADLLRSNNSEIIISKIKVNLDEKDYD